MDKKRIALARLANHEFNRALRASKIAPLEALRMLAGERTKALVRFSKLLGLALIGAIWIDARDQSHLLELTIYTLKLSVPVVYVNFLVAVLVFGAAINVTNYLVLNDFMRITANRVQKFGNASALATFYEGDNAWSTALVPQFRFLSSGRMHHWVMWTNLLFVGLPLILIVAKIYFVVLSVGLRALLSYKELGFEPILAVSALLLIVYPLAYAYLHRRLFTFTKNKRFIRWNFLAPLYTRHGLLGDENVELPRHVVRWLDEETARSQAISRP